MDLESVSKLKPKKGLFILIGIILLGIIFIASSFTSISGGNVGVVFVKIGKTPSDPSRIVVEKGEEGWQREVLMPGFKYVGLFARLWKINIYEEPMFTIKPGQVGTIEAFDGLPLRPGQILADDDEFDKDGKFIKMGQKGPRKTVLTPGTHPINPKYMKVDRQPAKFIKDGQIGIVTKLVGDMPPAGTILVSKEDNFRGIQKEILQPGEYYLNPKAVDIKIIDAIVIKKGQVGVVTKKIGDEPPYGTILVARESNFRGIQREILQPGMYYEYAHPYRYDVKIVPAINVPDGHIGVQIAKTGETKPFDQLLANAGQRGIRKDSLSPGLYYVNPFEFEIVVVDVRQQRYEMTLQADQGDTQGSDSITFLSDDGFEIEIDLTVL
ncbi:MAG: hypothetical protein L6408_06905, partial [Nanoarchaeota archaeon]|nr:hypothetical protein [Nanoarchaeota archaeon]